MGPGDLAAVPSVRSNGQSRTAGKLGPCYRVDIPAQWAVDVQKSVPSIGITPGACSILVAPQLPAGSGPQHQRR